MSLLRLNTRRVLPQSRNFPLIFRKTFLITTRSLVLCRKITRWKKRISLLITRNMSRDPSLSLVYLRNTFTWRQSTLVLKSRTPSTRHKVRRNRKTFGYVTLRRKQLVVIRLNLLVRLLFIMKKWSRQKKQVACYSLTNKRKQNCGAIMRFVLMITRQIIICPLVGRRSRSELHKRLVVKKRIICRTRVNLAQVKQFPFTGPLFALKWVMLLNGPLVLVLTSRIRVAHRQVYNTVVTLRSGRKALRKVLAAREMLLLILMRHIIRQVLDVWVKVSRTFLIRRNFTRKLG